MHYIANKMQTLCHPPLVNRFCFNDSIHLPDGLSLIKCKMMQFKQLFPEQMLIFRKSASFLLTACTFLV